MAIDFRLNESVELFYWDQSIRLVLFTDLVSTFNKDVFEEPVVFRDVCKRGWWGDLCDLDAPFEPLSRCWQCSRFAGNVTECCRKVQLSLGLVVVNLER